MKTGTICIIDDEVNVLKSLDRILSMDGHVVSTYTDAELALRDMALVVPDLVISDQRMPGMTGMEFLVRVKQDLPSVVRILMSGYTDFDVIISAINQGQIFYYIAKPWSNETLLQTIQNALNYKTEQDELTMVRRLMLNDEARWREAVSLLETGVPERWNRGYEALCKVIMAKDAELYTHSERVMQLCLKCADVLLLDSMQREYLRYGALLHDLGKIAVRDQVMYKEGRLNDNEYSEMKRHPEVGAEIVRSLEPNSPVAEIVEQHHERVDGHGYPFGLQGNAIRIEARILSIADAYDALTSDRVYRKGFGRAEALAIVRENSGSFYDPDVLNAFIEGVLPVAEQHTDRR